MRAANPRGSRGAVGELAAELWWRAKVGAGLVLVGAAVGTARPWAHRDSPEPSAGSSSFGHGPGEAAARRVDLATRAPVRPAGPGLADRVVTALWVAAVVLAVLAVVAVWWCWRRTSWRSGMVTRWELWRRLSRRAVRGTARRTRPVLMAATWVRRCVPGAARLLPATACGLRLGRVPRTRIGVWISHEEATLTEAPPREGKTGQLGNRVLDAPGAVVACSTKPDTATLTLPLRRRRGPVHVLNPEMLGRLLSTLRWSLVAGCANPTVAARRAGAMVAAAPITEVTDRGYWTEKATNVLRVYLHAADLAGYDMGKVAHWVRHPADDTPAAILAEHSHAAAAGWASSLAAILDLPDKTVASIFGTLHSVVSWTDDAALLDAVTPGEGEGFDIEEFLTSNGTLYLIGSDREGGTLAPLFAAFTTELFETAKILAGRADGQRLDPPLTLVLDEAPQICPVPLPKWTADAAGRGIVLHVAVQSRPQLELQWGPAGAAAILENLTTKIYLPSISNVDSLEGISRLLGEVSEEVRTESVDERGRPSGSSTHQFTRRVLTPDQIRTLPRGHAVVVHRNCPGVIIKTRPAWARLDVRAAKVELACATRWAVRGPARAARAQSSNVRAWVLARAAGAGLHVPAETHSTVTPRGGTRP
jgi:type IV secretion system protein VirD4